MKLSLVFALLAVASCSGGGAVAAPFAYCENTAGTGDLAQDIVGSWSLVVNAAPSTHTFLEDGRVLTYWGSDTDEPPIESVATYRLGDYRLVLELGAGQFTYDLAVDNGYWTVFRDGVDQDWRRCGPAQP